MRRSSDSVFLAIAHPARRDVIDLLAEQGRASVASILERTGLSPSALSQHLRMLKDARLVVDERIGRTSAYVLTPEPLLEIIDWMQRFRQTWLSQLDALEIYLDSLNSSQSTEKSRRRR